MIVNQVRFPPPPSALLTARNQKREPCVSANLVRDLLQGSACTAFPSPKDTEKATPNVESRLLYLTDQPVAQL